MRGISDRHLLIEDRKARDQQRRIERVVPDAIRIEFVETVHPAKIQAPRTSFYSRNGL